LKDFVFLLIISFCASNRPVIKNCTYKTFISMKNSKKLLPLLLLLALVLLEACNRGYGCPGTDL